MKKAINSRKNKYQIQVDASFRRGKGNLQRQSWGPLFSFKEKCGSAIEKNVLGAADPFYKTKKSDVSVSDLFCETEKKGVGVFFQDKKIKQSEERKLCEKRKESVSSAFSKGKNKTKVDFFPLEKNSKTTKQSEKIEPGGGGFYPLGRDRLLPLAKGVTHQLLKLVESSSHFGRKSRSLDFTFPWHTSMCSKFLGVRNKIPHISGEESLQSLVEAFYCIALVLRKGGKVLVVNKNQEFSSLFHTNSLDTKSSLPKRGSFSQKNLGHLHPSFHPSVKSKNFLRKYAESRGQCKPAIADFKWVGGCLTNWKQISKSVATLLYFSKRFGLFIKQNNIHFPRFKKMTASFQGFIHVEKEQLLLKAPPQLLFLFNAHESQQILHEAIKLQIPVVALTDSSTDLSQITYPIPINSDSTRLVHRCLSQLMQMTDRQGAFQKQN